MWRKIRPKGGRIRNTLWDDINETKGNEDTGYPTQKPLPLYERIILASSDEGDIILDPFAGCATTCIAAERLGRGWIGVDINEKAKDVMLHRLRREAQLPQGAQSWNREVHIRTKAPKRTDDGHEAAPELTLVSPQPRGPRMTIKQLRERLGLEDGVVCQGCGYVPPTGLVEYLEVDHKQPRSIGGRDHIRNRVLLCAPCNGVKGNNLTLSDLRLKRIEEGRMLDRNWTREWWETRGRFA